VITVFRAIPGRRGATTWKQQESETKGTKRSRKREGKEDDD